MLNIFVLLMALLSCHRGLMADTLFLDQNQLKGLIKQNKVVFKNYVKMDVIEVYKKDAGSVLPKCIQDVLGAADRTEYTPNDDEEYYGLQQRDNGDLDVYRIDDFLNTYEITSGHTQSKRFLNDANVIFARKKGDVPMIALSALGISLDKEVTITAPWDGTQTKKKNTDAFLACTQNRSYYLVQQEKNGLPVKYTPSPNS
jgi:hypothetical protein